MADKVFNFDADFGKNYDTHIRQSFFAYEQKFTLITSLLKNRLPDDANILVVGSGTGMEITTFGEQMTGWHFTGVDPSNQMVQITQQKVSERGWDERVKLINGYASDVPEGENFDAATLILILHFIPDDAGKLSLLKEVANRLRPGGTLVYISLHGDLSKPATNELMLGWRNFMVKNGIPPERATQMQEAAMANGQFVPEERVLSLIEQAGFTDIVPFYRAFLVGGWLARKA
jgi:tRNA (cmo5U34)-methyltransferase